MSNHLFTPCNIGSLTLKNRLVRSATQDPFGQPDGTVSQPQIDLYGTLARNEVGLIINAHSYVSPEGRATGEQIGFCTEAHYAGNKKVVDAVHANGGKIFLQVNHAGMSTFVTNEGFPIGPSGGVKSPSGQVVKEMDAQEMDRVCDAFVTAAVKGKELGFDGVELHCAHGYLLSQFLDLNFNHRTDEFGGSAENRFRYPRRILLALREALGKDYPIAVKVNSNCMGEYDKTYEEDLLYYAKQFEACGADCIELSGFDAWAKNNKDNHDYYLARAMKVAAAVSIPVMLVGGIRNAADRETALRGGVSFLSMCRPFICEPDLALKLKEDPAHESPCISCSKCFVLWGREGRRCVQHPKPEETNA